jgi:DNA-binding transcriptional LysR family regulator
VAVHAVRPHDLVVVAAPDLAAGAARAGAQDGPEGLLAWLARQTWLLREPGSGTRASTAALLAELDITPLALMVGSNGAIRESARVGLGVTLVSRDAVAAELAGGALAEIGVPGTPLHRDWFLVARRGSLPPPAARLVRHVLHTGAFRAPDRAPG